jgi:ribosomal protein S12 methylthiotransferase accessory factor
MSARIDPETSSLSQVFAAAARALSGAAAVEGPAGRLLAQLDYLDGRTDEAPHRAALLRAAAGFVRVFTLRAEDAPGLFVVGAEVDPAGAGVRDAAPASVSGTGVTFRQAFESCTGEGIEYVSQFATADDAIEPMTAADALTGASPAVADLWLRLLPWRRRPEVGLTDWTIVADLADGASVRLPADICFRRPAEARDIDPPWPLSSGCGAATDHLLATLHGLFELIERDAVALWWRGGRRARLAPTGVGSETLSQVRAGATGRRTWLLDITNDTRVPTLVAASCDDSGFGLCCGFAARATAAEAADAAVREMAQMELAYRVAATKRATRGEAALNATDRRHIARFTSINVAETPALHPIAPPLPACDLPADDPLALLAALREMLHRVGVAPCALNLTRAAFGVPAVRVLCPGLETGLEAPPGSRLRAACEQSGTDPTNVASLI